MSVNAGNDKEPSASLPPQPDPDFDTRGFWDATAQGELKMCHCSACGLWMMPPLEKCRKCAAPTRFDKVQGTGTIYTFIVQRQGAVSGFLSTLPYTVAIVELDEQEGLRLPGRLVNIAPENVRCGLRVKASFEDLPGGEFKVPVFQQSA